jgi:mono/diheme cytochrome c family protein
LSRAGIRIAAIAGAVVLIGCAETSTWAEMNLQEREAFMRDVVVPNLAPVFRDYDAERFQEFGCATCHGPDAEARAYAMPADLFALPLDTTLETARAHDSPMTDFMLDEVFPRFVDLIDAEKYGPQTPDGYRCTGCHAVAD